MASVNNYQIEAFWSKVAIQKDKNKCWEWQGARNTKGYGNLRINKNYTHAHRVAWETTNFPIPAGYLVMHLCDNPACCNPSHLVLGTVQTNTCDMLIKNRQGFHKNRATGTRNANAKLTDDIVRDIKAFYPTKNQYQLADKYGVSQPTIGCIVRGETWRHVE